MPFEEEMKVNYFQPMFFIITSVIARHHPPSFLVIVLILALRRQDMQGGGKPLHVLHPFSYSCLSTVFKEEIGYVRVAQKMPPLEDFYLCKLHGQCVSRLNARKSFVK